MGLAAYFGRQRCVGLLGREPPGLKEVAISRDVVVGYVGQLVAKSEVDPVHLDLSTSGEGQIPSRLGTCEHRHCR